MGRAFNILAGAFASIGSFLFGYDSGIIASVLVMPSFVKQFNPSSSIQGAIVSTFTGGCFFGAAGAAWSSDRFGRKRTIQIGCLWAILGCSLQAGASNLATLLVGRIVAGVAVGILSMVVPVYNTEIAPPSIRGFVVGLAQQMIGFGFIAANWVGYGSQFFSDSRQWRLPLGLQLVPATLLLAGIHFFPIQSGVCHSVIRSETVFIIIQRWLIEQGRETEAREVVARLHAASGSSAAEAEREFAEMRDSIRAELLVRSRRLSDLWATRANVRRLVVACGVQVFTQFTGINVLNYFGPQLYKSLGFANNKLLLLQGINGALGPIANFFFITFALDSIGRKKPLMFGAALIVALFCVLSAILASFPPAESFNGPAQKAGVAVIFLIGIVFSVSFGPVSWVLASEVFPTRTRSIGTAIATCSNWGTNVLISQVSPLALANIGWRYDLVFIFLNAFDFVIIWLFFPETKGKTLEEMAVVFGDAVDAVEVLKQHGELVSQDGDVRGDSPDVKEMSRDMQLSKA